MEFISHSPAETEEVGESWGRVAQSGLVIAMSGDLGAGKTQLVKGIARGLGVTARVHSPTFTLVNEYGGGRLRLFHLDLYRLETQAQILGAGLEDYLQPDGVTVIEWAERMFGVWSLEFRVRSPAAAALARSGAPRESGVQSPPALCRRVKIEVVGETERRITYEDAGA